METAFLLVFLALLFGSMILILALGYQGTEQERAAARKEAAVAALHALEGPRFFAHLEPSVAAPTASAELALLVRNLEEHLRHEHRVAVEFVNHPSVDRLFPGYGAYAETMARELEHHLQRESRLAAAFVAQPSLEGLFRDATAGFRDVSAA